MDEENENKATVVRARKHKRVKLPWYSYLIYLLLATISVTGVSFARFQTTITGSSSVEVGAPVFVCGADTVILAEVTAPVAGSSTNYVFSVSNDDNGVSDANLTYTIKVSATGNLPITYTLTRTDTDPDAVAGTVGGTGDGTAVTFTTSGVDLLNTSAVTHTYSLNVAWNGSYKSTSFVDEVDMMRIEANWVQKAE